MVNTIGIAKLTASKSVPVFEVMEVVEYNLLRVLSLMKLEIMSRDISKPTFGSGKLNVLFRTI